MERSKNLVFISRGECVRFHYSLIGLMKGSIMSDRLLDILEYIEVIGGVCIKEEIMEGVGISKTNIGKYINKLLEMGLIEVIKGIDIRLVNGMRYSDGMKYHIGLSVK